MTILDRKARHTIKVGRCVSCGEIYETKSLKSPRCPDCTETQVERRERQQKELPYYLKTDPPARKKSCRI